MVSAQTRKVIAAGMIGNVLEWFTVLQFRETYRAPFAPGTSGAAAAYA